jgi:hypothetical protein
LWFKAFLNFFNTLSDRLAISDPASDSSDSPPVDYSEYLLMKDQFQPAGFNPSKYDFGDQFLFSNSGFLVQGGK